MLGLPSSHRRDLSESSAIPLPGRHTPSPACSHPTPLSRPKNRAPWRPWALRPSFLIPFILSLFILAISLQLLRFVVNDRRGGLGLISHSSWIHFTWTQPPIILSTLLTLLLTSVVFKVERLMPWFAMSGQAPQSASATIKIDYLDYLAFLVPYHALKNKHWIVFVCSVISLVGMGLSASVAPLMYLQPIVVDQPLPVLSAAEPGLVHWYRDLEGFYSAMADMTSSIKNGANGMASPTPWISSDGWTVGRFSISPSIIESASLAVQEQHLAPSNITATVSAIQHDAGCESTVVDIQGDGNFNFNSTATGVKTGCVHQRNFSIRDDCCDLWGGDHNDCGRTQPDGSPLDFFQHSFVFWTARLVNKDPTSLPNVSITICTPTYKLHRNVEVLIDVTSHVILKATLKEQPSGSLEIDPIFNGSAFNGYALDWFNNLPTNSIEADRKSAIRTGLLSAIVFKGEVWPYSPYANDSYTFITRNVYLTYLSLIGRDVYFTEETAFFQTSSNSGRLVLHTPEVRLFVNAFSAHLASGILAFIASGLCLVSVALHRMKDRHIPISEGAIWTSAIAAKHVTEDQLLGAGTMFKTRAARADFLDPPIPPWIEAS